MRCIHILAEFLLKLRCTRARRKPARFQHVYNFFDFLLADAWTMVWNLNGCAQEILRVINLCLCGCNCSVIFEKNEAAETLLCPVMAILRFA
jgi:hypothetical protein